MQLNDVMNCINDKNIEIIYGDLVKKYLCLCLVLINN